MAEGVLMSSHSYADVNTGPTSGGEARPSRSRRAEWNRT